MSDTYLLIKNLLLTREKRARPDDFPTERTFSPEIGIEGEGRGINN
jgi:hypothetical protein